MFFFVSVMSPYLYRTVIHTLSHPLLSLLPSNITLCCDSTLNLQCPVSSRELCEVLANFDLMFSMCVCFDRALNHNNHNITVKVNAGALHLVVSFLCEFEVLYKPTFSVSKKVLFCFPAVNIMPLFTCRSVHQGDERFNSDFRGKQCSFISLMALLSKQFPRQFPCASGTVKRR